VDVHDGVGRLLRVHHPRKRHKVPLGQAAVISGVIVAVHVRHDTSVLPCHGQHLGGIPQVVHV
ncbi:uncharacterized protein METZ01_LOCUS461193, partial [marine metagenome]